MDTDWAWATESRRPGFCLTFVRDRDPATVAGLLGGGPPATMTAVEAGEAFPISLRGSLLRCGSVAPWAYCYEDRAPVAFRASLRQRLSEGTELVQVVKSADGMRIVRRMVNGRQTEQFEPRRGADNRGAGPAVLLPRIERLLVAFPEMSVLVAALRTVGRHVGAVLTPGILDGPLMTAFSTETATAPPTPVTGRPAGLGRRLGSFSLSGQPLGDRPPWIG
ncbi:hypothetical protein Asp14428_18310 [Actinoplanes sp. NBRC 14428]|uniref:Uncharacterized protein n=1 Tax=Pseudosporangium ferrugineum TaxID=439699 RepID=A0A2T0SBK2_9ACTN|nr:DUF6461 domain-containing protein [Pseudosporangium ferrugineum]PRY30798.1 hypothetical protein CLV70_104350 [Pseudosporangium ferrugineum]BCJ50356.1 hypothetical protein Asp14428_18310 [Actinoplanes sp. NBRC 14428]